MDQYCMLVLLYLFNPIVSSLRAVQQASELKKVQKKLGCERASLGSLSESVTAARRLRSGAKSNNCRGRGYESEPATGLVASSPTALPPLRFPPPRWNAETPGRKDAKSAAFLITHAPANEKGTQRNFDSAGKRGQFGCMPRRSRISPSGACFHVLNRAVARSTLFVARRRGSRNELRPLFSLFLFRWTACLLLP